MPTTPNMGMVLPTEGASDNVWDTLLNAALTLNDAHNHTTGQGVKVPTAGLNINADLSFGGAYALTNLLAADFTPVAAASVSTYAGAFFVNSGDSNNLYWRTPSGTNVKVIDGTTLNVAAFVGGIGGDYSSASALVAYSSSGKNYTFKGPDPGGGRPWNAIAASHYDFYEHDTTVANRVRIQSPSALAASYAITLPAALPGAAALLQVSSAGVGSFSNTLTVAFKATDLQYTTAQTVYLPSAIAQAVASGPTFNGANWTHGTSVQPLYFPVTVRAGDTIGSWLVYLNKTSASGTLTASLVRMAIDNSSGPFTVGSAQTNNANNPGVIALQEIVNHAVVSGFQYYIVVTPSGTTGDTTLGAQHTLTRV